MRDRLTRTHPENEDVRPFLLTRARARRLQNRLAGLFGVRRGQLERRPALAHLQLQSPVVLLAHVPPIHRPAEALGDARVAPGQRAQVLGLAATRASRVARRPARPAVRSRPCVGSIGGTNVHLPLSSHGP